MVAPTLPAQSWDLARRFGPERGLDPALVAAVIGAESGGDPNAQSGAGAKGLMQLMDATAAALGVSNSFDPIQNVDGGTRLLAGLLRQFGSVELALAAYNAGPGAVAAAGGVPRNGETEVYVPRVLGYWRDYQGSAPAAVAGAEQPAAAATGRPWLVVGGLGLAVLILAEVLD